MKTKNYKNFNKKLLLTLLSLLVGLAFFNFIVDPFDIFKTVSINHFNALKPDKNRQQRVTKIVELKLDKKPVDAIFMGSSRVDKSIDASYFIKLSGENTKNLAMNALTHNETIKIAQNALAIHPEIKTIYVGLDFFRFLESQADGGRKVSVSNNKKLTINESNPLILSFDTVVASFNTVFENITYKAPVDSQNIKKPDPSEGFIHRLSQYKSTYDKAQLSREEIEKLKDFQNEMKKYGVKVVFYTNPTHASDLCLIKTMGYLGVFDEWKSEMAKSFEYVDFDFVNPATGERIDENTHYFYESSHSTFDMGNLVSDRLVSSKDDEYGVKITAENVAKNIRRNDEALKKWEQKNPDWVKNINDIVNEDKGE